MLCSPRPRPHGSGARSHARLVARAWHLVAHGLASAGVRRRPHRVPTDRCGNPRQAYPSPVFFAPINGFAVHTQCWHTVFSHFVTGPKDGKKKEKRKTVTRATARSRRGNGHRRLAIGAAPALFPGWPPGARHGQRGAGVRACCWGPGATPSTPPTPPRGVRTLVADNPAARCARARCARSSSPTSTRWISVSMRMRMRAHALRLALVAA